MPGLSFLNKKSWHTTNVKNVERVWLAEKKAEEEQKRLAELQKQLQEERQILELRQLQAAHGQVTKTIDNSLDWMYEGPVSQNQKQQSSEEYLLGKIYNGAADHSKVAAVIPDPKAPAKWMNKVASKNDSFSRAHEDPFIMIKQEENRRREKLVNNPIKMDKIKQKIALELKEKEDKKSAKKAAKREKKEQKKDAKRRKKETQREGQSGEKDGNSSSSDSGSGSESEGHTRKDRHSRELYTTEVKHEHGASRENKPVRSRSNSLARDTRPSDRHDAQNEKERSTRSDDRPHDARRETRRDSRERGTDRARERQNSRDRSDVAREHRDRGDRDDRDGNRGGRGDRDRGTDDRRRDSGYTDRRTDRDHSRDRDRRGQYDSRRNDEGGRYNRDNRDSDRHTDRGGRDRRDDGNHRSDSRRSNSRQRDYRNHPASSHHNTSHASNTSNGPSESRKRDRSPSPAAPAPAADRTITNRHTAHSDSENSESSQSKPKQRYGLLPNKNRVNSGTSSSSDHNSSSSSNAASLGPNPALLQKKVDAEKAAELARKNRARADVRGLTDEERQQRILAMQEDAQKNDAVRAVRHDPERKVAEVDENTGNAAFLDSMRKTVYTTGDTDMQSRLDQNKYSRQSAADIDSAEGFLRK